MSLNKDDLLKLGAPETHEVELASLNGEKVRVKEWDGAIRDAVNQNGGVVINNFQIVQYSLCNENGELVFPGEEGLAKLKKLKLKVVDELARKCLKINAIDDEEAAKLEKNFEQIQNGASTSDSQPVLDAQLANSSSELVAAS